MNKLLGISIFRKPACRGMPLHDTTWNQIEDRVGDQIHHALWEVLFPPRL
jgi:hypothetical protein